MLCKDFIHIIQIKISFVCIYLFSGVTDVQECGGPGALDYNINIEAFDYNINLSARPRDGDALLWSCYLNR